MLALIGKVFTPLMLILLGWIIITGIITPATSTINTPALRGFFFGLKEGYFTLDAIAALVFGQFIYVQLRQQRHDMTHVDFKKHVVHASCYAGVLLSLVYIGLAYISHKQADMTMMQPDLKQALLILLSVKMLPQQFISVAGIIIASACITTACALSKIFADYLHHYLRRYTQKITETHCLILTIIIAYGVSLLGFNELMAYFAPVIVACYPVFILLTIHAFVKDKVPARVMPFAIAASLLLGVAGVFYPF
jgi:LIVCS family branched-chain amino acid:cation transporter